MDFADDTIDAESLKRNTLTDDGSGDENGDGDLNHRPVLTEHDDPLVGTSRNGTDQK